MPRIRRGGKRIRGSNGGRTRNEECCCAPPDDCGFSGTRPTELQLTIPSGCTSHNGAHLLTNTGTEAELRSATGIELSDPEDVCWAWWEATGVNANEWYLIAVESGIASGFIWCTSPFGVESWAPGAAVSNWIDLDGYSVNWFAQFGASQCPGTSQSPISIDYPP